MLKRLHYIALGLVVLSTLVILNLPSQTSARFKLGIGSLFLPLFGLASTTQHLTGSAVAEGTGRVLQELQFLKRVSSNSK